MGRMFSMKYNAESFSAFLEKIDLTKAQRNRAVELYTNVCNAIGNKTGLEIAFYPQGSFATKTAVRPYKNGKDQAYDVDVICEVLNADKMTISPKKLKEIFRIALKNSIYANKMEEWDKCFTINFKEQDGVSFSIDIIPSVSEDDYTKDLLSNITEFSSLVDSSIAIPNSESNSWITNNPKGYVQWFETEIEKFKLRYFMERNDKKIYTSI